MQVEDYFSLLNKQLIQAGEELVGLSVLHETLGDGVVTKVEKRANQKSLIDIKFSNGKKATFNELSVEFFQIPPQIEEIATSLLEFLKLNCKEILDVEKAQHKLHERLGGIKEQIDQTYERLYERLQHYNIANFYNQLVERCSDTEALTDTARLKVPDVSALIQHSEGAIQVALEVHQELLSIEQVLQKIDLSLDLDPEEIEGLAHKKLFNLLATASYRSYRKSDDLWALMQACKYLRKAKKPAKVIELTQGLANNKSHQLHSKILSAIYTTRGAAFKDLSDLTNATEMANLALACDESKFSHNLMGAICYWKQEFNTGDAHFDRALELGSTNTDRIAEIRSARTKLDAEGRAKLEAHLASINLKV